MTIATQQNQVDGSGRVTGVAQAGFCSAAQWLAKINTAKCGPPNKLRLSSQT